MVKFSKSERKNISFYRSCAESRSTPSIINDDYNLELIIGVSVTVFVLLLAAVFIVIKALKRKRKYRKDRPRSKEIEMTIQENPRSRSLPILLIMNGKVSLPSKDEFEELLSYDGGITQRFTTSQGERFNDKKFRFNIVPENIPFDHNRLRLKNPINNCDYVNANTMTLPSEDRTYDELIYTTHLPFKSIQWAIGQNPIPHTMNHHFRLIHENKFDYIVSFAENPGNTLFKSGSTYHYKDLLLKVHKRTKVKDHLFRTEFSVFNESTIGYQYNHHATYFEFVNWPKEEIMTTEDADELVPSLSAIRNEISRCQSPAKIFTHDFRGGVGSSALFMVMYECMEEIDASFTEDNRLKKCAPDIDVFQIVNKLRKNRAKMIENFSTYKLLFHCINNYGKNRVSYHEEASKDVAKLSTGNNEHDQGEGSRVNIHDVDQNEPEFDAYVAEEREYVLHESSEEERNNIFDEYDI